MSGGSTLAQMSYMPSQTDLYFPVTDARYEAKFIPHCTLPDLAAHQPKCVAPRG
jgi:hypothetical protein